MRRSARRQRGSLTSSECSRRAQRLSARIARFCARSAAARSHGSRRKDVRYEPGAVMIEKPSDRCTCGCSRWRHSYSQNYCTTPNCKCPDFEMAPDQTPPPPAVRDEDRNLEYDRRRSPRYSEEELSQFAEWAREAEHARRMM